MTRPLRDVERAFIAEAAAYLERPSFALRAQRLLGRPVELLLSRLPAVACRTLDRASEAALRRALDVALTGLPRQRSAAADDQSELQDLIANTYLAGNQRIAAAGATGFVGGMLGGLTLAAELSATTILMLRSIADIAAHLGADLDDPNERLECVAVFGLGAGPPPARLGGGLHQGVQAAPVDDDALHAKTAYYATRVGLQRATIDLGRMAAQLSADDLARLLLRSKSPALAELLGKIAGRYGTVVSQKSALQVLPILGAASAAAINVAFLDHHHRVARYHFGLRWLERRCGPEAVRLEFERSALLLPAES